MKLTVVQSEKEEYKGLGEIDKKMASGQEGVGKITLPYGQENYPFLYTNTGFAKLESGHINSLSPACDAC